MKEKKYETSFPVQWCHIFSLSSLITRQIKPVLPHPGYDALQRYGDCHSTVYCSSNPVHRVNYCDLKCLLFYFFEDVY